MTNLALDGGAVLDPAHLERQTLADTTLAFEMLRLFQAQAAQILADLKVEPDPAAAADLAHRLKGAALAVGAFRVATAAEVFEARVTDHLAGKAALDVLAVCIEDARAAITGVIAAS